MTIEACGRYFSYAVIAWCLLLLGYGVAVFPDAPYRPCAASSGYCGKSGSPHEESEFRALKRWEHVMFLSWPCGILVGLVVGKSGKRWSLLR